MQREHLGFLDGLRALAIMGVVLVHVSQSVPGLPLVATNVATFGSRGVQLFFAVSGFTLVMNYLDRAFEPLQFFIRRFFRIAPMFYIAALYYVLLGLVSHLRFAVQNPSLVQLVLPLLFLHGWTPASINYVVPGGWSIAAEAMFYLCFPAFLILMRRRRVFFAFTLATYPAALATKILLQRYVPGDPDPVNKFAMFFWLTQLPAFVSGCTLALIARQMTSFSIEIARKLFVVSLIAVAIAAILRVGANFLLADILFAALVFTAALAKPAMLENHAMMRIGKVSYSIYLTHFAFVGFFDLFATGLAAKVGSHACLVLGYLMVFACAFLASEITYRWIELPMIEVGRRLSRSRRTVALA